MQYLSSHYWQQEDKARTSLVLQHLVYRKRKIPVLFACICSGASWGDGSDNAHFAKQLTAWFQQEGREKLVSDVSKDFVGLKNGIREQMVQIDKELAAYNLKNHVAESERISVTGVLCIDGNFVLFHRGNSKVYLLNTRFGRTNCRCLVSGDSEELQILSGEMEPNIGLLLTTKDFGAGLSTQQLGECLAVRDVLESHKIRHRLSQLGEEAARWGGRHMGAVLLVTQK